MDAGPTRQRESHDRTSTGPAAPTAVVRPAARRAAAVQPTGTPVFRHAVLPAGSDGPRPAAHLGHREPPVGLPRRVCRRPVVPGPAGHVHHLQGPWRLYPAPPVSYTHLRAHETDSYLVCRLLLEK